MTAPLLIVVGVVATHAAIRHATRATRAGRVIGRRPRRSLPRLRAEAPSWLTEAAQSTPLHVAPTSLWRGYLLVLGVAGVAAFAVAGPVLAVLAVASVLGAPHIGNAIVRARRDASYDAALVVGLDAVARAVRGGGSLHAAVGEAAAGLRGAVARDFQRIDAATRRGLRFDTALHEWRVQRDRPSVHLAVGAIALAAQTGGPPARVIEEVAASLRMRMQVEGEARSLGAQARLSAIVVGVAPIGFAFLACSLDPRNAALMFGTPIGVACLVAGLAFDLAGAIWMHRISQTVLQ